MSKYFAWILGYDRREFEALDAESAALMAIEEYEREGAEYRVAAGKATEIVIVEDEAGTVHRFEVSGEAVPSYRARSLD